MKNNTISKIEYNESRIDQNTIENIRILANDLHYAWLMGKGNNPIDFEAMAKGIVINWFLDDTTMKTK